MASLTVSTHRFLASQSEHARLSGTQTLPETPAGLNAFGATAAALSMRSQRTLGDSRPTRVFKCLEL